MKFSPFFFAAVVAEEVPYRHPTERLHQLTEFSEEILNDWFDFLPSKDAWIRKFANNAKRMERKFNTPCGDRSYYSADDEIELGEYNREDPSEGIEQITTGFSQWAERYLGQCSGQKKNKLQINRMEKWNNRLQNHLSLYNHNK